MSTGVSLSFCLFCYHNNLSSLYLFLFPCAEEVWPRKMEEATGFCRQDLTRCVYDIHEKWSVSVSHLIFEHEIQYKFKTSL